MPVLPAIEAAVTVGVHLDPNQAAITAIHDKEDAPLTKFRGLTEEDQAQQEAGHSHGAGADHTHEDEATDTPDGSDDKHQR